MRYTDLQEKSKQYTDLAAARFRAYFNAYISHEWTAYRSVGFHIDVPLKCQVLALEMVLDELRAEGFDVKSEKINGSLQKVILELK